MDIANDSVNRPIRSLIRVVQCVDADFWVSFEHDRVPAVLDGKMDSLKKCHSFYL